MKTLSEFLEAWDYTEEKHQIDTSYREYIVGDNISYGDMKPTTHPNWDETVYVEVPYTTGSDYSGGTVTRSNFLVLSEDDEYAGLREAGIIVEAYGGYSTYAIFVALNVPYDNEDDLEVLAELIRDVQDYIVINEDHMSELEMELENEAWDGWVEDDFQRALYMEFESDIEVEHALDSFVEDELWDIWTVAREDANEYPIFETGCLVYYDINRIVGHVSRQLILDVYDQDDFMWYL